MIGFDESTCNACGTCAAICPRYVFEHEKKGDRKRTWVCKEREGLCIECGHCMALCPTGSIRVGTMDPDAFVRMDPLDADPKMLTSLLEHRRSVRRYRDRQVPREVLDRIASAGRLAPTPSSVGLGVIVIDEAEKLARLSEHAYALYEKLLAAQGSFFGRRVLKSKIGAQKLENMSWFLFPALRWYIRWYREGKGNEIMRDCPALMLFHVPVREPSGDESCVMAASFAMLMAECLGVGSCFNGLVTPACNRSEGARAMLGLDGSREVHSALTLGYPVYKFKRSIPRTGGEIRYL